MYMRARPTLSTGAKRPRGDLTQAVRWIQGASVLARTRGTPCRAASREQPAAAAAEQEWTAPRFDPGEWPGKASGLLSSLGLPPQATSPQALWQHLADTFPLDRDWVQQQEGQDNQQPNQQQPAQQEREQPPLQLDAAACRLLMSAAAATCSTQRQCSQLWPLLAAMPAVFPQFSLQAFRQLLQLCVQARFVPDKEWMASAYYADTGGIERFYKQESPESLVLLLSDLALALDSSSWLHKRPTDDDLEQQLVQQTDTLQDPGMHAQEAAALQDASCRSQFNLSSILADRLLAGELSAVGGYWLLRRFMPALINQPQLILTGLCALPGLQYKVLDSEDADLLLAYLTSQLQHWTPSQLAAAVIDTLPCLVQPPTEGQQLALLFAAIGAAAADMEPQDAACVLIVLGDLPGYAPDPKVAQALLSAALQPPPPGSRPTPPGRMSTVLETAEMLGAAPTGSQQMQLVQEALSTGPMN